ncbi:hypothetical protein I5678_15670 [Citrobacter freundii]|nr:hypothetical protein [Citrobacter freundii]
MLVFWRAVSNVSIPTQRSSTLFMANSHCQMKATAATGTSHKQAPHHPIVAPKSPQRRGHYRRQQQGLTIPIYNPYAE